MKIRNDVKCIICGQFCSPKTGVTFLEGDKESYVKCLWCLSEAEFKSIFPNKERDSQLRTAKYLTQRQIDKAFVEFKRNLKSGDSINVARAKACGQVRSKLALAVMQKPEYLKVLNDYLKRIGRSNQYIRTENGLVSPRKS